MRYLGLDLGTKTLGVAVTDKTRTISQVLKVIHFHEFDYDLAILELDNIIKDLEISKIILGLPKNMNNTLGYASSRSLEFKEKLEKKYNIPVFLVDERLSTKEAEKFLISSDIRRENRKKVIDGVAARIILDTYLKMEENIK